MISSGIEKVLHEKEMGLVVITLCIQLRYTTDKLICFRSLTNLKVQTGANRLLTNVFLYMHGVCSCVCVYMLCTCVCVLCVCTHLCVCM